MTSYRIVVAVVLALAAGACRRTHTTVIVVPATPAGQPAPPPIAQPAPSGDGADVVGNGQSATEPRALADFTRVTNRTSLDVRVTQGDAFHVAVTADANVVPLVTTTVADGVLTVSASRSFSTRVPSHVDVTIVRFEGAENDGSGALDVAAPQADAIALTAQGSGRLSYTGRAGAVTVALSGSGTMALSGTGSSLTGTTTGSGELHAGAFIVQGATLTTTGSGDAIVAVRGDATLSVQGSGDIQARLDLGTANFNVMGSGHIVWRGGATVGASNVTGSGGVVRSGS